MFLLLLTANFQRPTTFCPRPVQSEPKQKTYDVPLSNSVADEQIQPSIGIVAFLGCLICVISGRFP
jgi:hypothetical protein